MKKYTQGPLWMSAAEVLAAGGPVEAVDIPGLLTQMLAERHDMLKALEQAVQIIKYAPGCGKPGTPATYTDDACHTAIAKAKGEA